MLRSYLPDSKDALRRRSHQLARSNCDRVLVEIHARPGGGRLNVRYKHRHYLSQKMSQVRNNNSQKYGSSNVSGNFGRSAASQSGTGRSGFVSLGGLPKVIVSETQV